MMNASGQECEQAREIFQEDDISKIAFKDENFTGKRKGRGGLEEGMIQTDV